MATEYIPIMGHVAIMDGLLILGIYLITAIVYKNLLWIKNIKKEQIYIFSILGLIVAAVIEYRAIFVLDKWTYSNLMPTIFGLGLSPLIQLTVTGLIAIWLTRKLVFGKKL